MVTMTSLDISEDEAQLYDRQIRLWGLESQKRLRRARVLIIGCQGFGAEICKNIILSGVKSVTIMDSGVVSELDVCSQFLAPRSEIGKNRAEASLQRAQELNPMVEVSADSDNIEDKPDSFFGGFDIICATECSTKQMVHLDQICREKDVKFLCGDVFGFFGYLFLDLQIQEFAEEVTTIPNAGGSVEPAAKRAKVEPIVQTVKDTETYVPLQDALDVDWTSDEYKKRLRRMDPSYFVMRVLQKFHDSEGRKPDPASRSKDIETLESILKEELAKQKLSEDTVPKDLLKDVFAEVSPVCAIMGGIASQEIIKTVSQKERPHNNIFFFNPLSSLGYSACFGV